MKTLWSSMISQNKRASEGFSLIETLITVALIGIVAAIWVRYMQGANQMISDAQMRQKVVGIEHYLLGFPDCAATSADPNFSSSCALSSPINIRDKLGNVVIPSSGRVFGSGASSVKVTNSCNDGTIIFTAEISGATSTTRTLYDGIPWYCPTTGSAKQCIKVKDNLCPTNFAVLGMNDGYGNGINYSHEIQCCPIPSDLLLDDHESSSKNCGADRVVTGVTIAASGDRNLRCTKINTAIYALETETKASFFETSPWNSASGWKEGSTRVHLETTNALSGVQKFFLMKDDNLKTDPNFPGGLDLDSTTSSAYISQCISPNGLGLFTGRESKNCGKHKTKVAQLRMPSGPFPTVDLFPKNCTGTFSNTSNTVTMTQMKCSTFPVFWSETPNLKRQ